MTGHTAVMTRRRLDQPSPGGAPPKRTRDLLLAFPIGAVAAVLVWIGDMRLSHRDWAIGAVVFGLGLFCTFLAVRQLRRAGLVR